MLRLLIKRWGDNIKVYLRKIGCEMEWNKMEVAQNCVQWEASVLLMLIFGFNPNFFKSTYTLTIYFSCLKYDLLSVNICKLIKVIFCHYKKYLLIISTTLLVYFYLFTLHVIKYSYSGQ